MIRLTPLPPPTYQYGFYCPFVPLLTTNGSVLGGKLRPDLPHNAGLCCWDGGHWTWEELGRYGALEHYQQADQPVVVDDQGKVL